VNLEQQFILLIDTKNGDKRGVPFTDMMVGVLREIRIEQEQAEFVSPWVFPNPLTGKPYRHDSNTAWYRALRMARITDFRFHDLRHTCGSYLAMRGVDIRTIQEILGHKTLAMTQRYTHLAASHKLAAIRQLDAAYLSDQAMTDQITLDQNTTAARSIVPAADTPPVLNWQQKRQHTAETSLLVTDQVLEKTNAPGETRTPNLRVRSPVLYPIELQAHKKNQRLTTSGRLL
jgi:hypothetical protein